MGKCVDVFGYRRCYGISCTVVGGCLLEGDAVEESEGVMDVVLELVAGWVGVLLLITEGFTA